jgi:hypothetical protein
MTASVSLLPKSPDGTLAFNSPFTTADGSRPWLNATLAYLDPGLNKRCGNKKRPRT